MKAIVVIIILGFVANLNAQFVNINPDPNGDPWWVFTGEDSLCYDRDLCIEHPPLILSNESISKDLPYVVDNSEKKFFRPVFNQGGMVCAAAVKIGYIYTYEINRLRDVSAEDSVNLYSHYYEANYYNIWTEDSLFTDWGVIPTTVELIKKNGIPNILDFGEIMVDPNYHWVNGYEKWERAMHNRTINEWELITLNEDSLYKLKHWINDHAIGDSTGGLVKISCKVNSDMVFDTLKFPSQNAGDLYIKYFGTALGHQMTIVGYNDSIMVDYNEDGLITDTIDLNGDDIIDLRDWENGAFKIVNSEGDEWQNDGFSYFPYRLLALDTGGITNNKVVGMYVLEDY